MLTPAVGGLIGTGLELAGGLFSNKKNIDLAREQMDFQREMANTQYQRSARDLKAAGLNRILALGGPSATPGGARPNIVNPAAGMANSAKNLTLLKAQKNLLDKQATAQTAAASAAWGAEWLNEMKAQTEIANRDYVNNNAMSVKLNNLIRARELEEYRKNPWLMRYKMLAQGSKFGAVATGASSVYNKGKEALNRINQGRWD